MRPELMEAILRLTDEDSPFFRNVQVKDGILTATNKVATVQIPCDIPDGLYSAEDCTLQAVIAKHKEDRVDLSTSQSVESHYPDVDEVFSWHKEDCRVYLDAQKLRDLCDIAIAAAQEGAIPEIALVINKPCENMNERWVAFYFRNYIGDTGRLLLSPLKHFGKPFQFKEKREQPCKPTYFSFVPE
jgi:hypothetical protein